MGREECVSDGDDAAVIELTHVATGALAGRRCAGPIEALLSGVVMHALMDVAPHAEVHDTRFEVASSVAGIATLAAACGLRSPLTWGAIGGALPDIEHVLPHVIRPRRELFPSHRYGWMHSRTGVLEVPVWVQAVFGGAIIGALAVTGLQRARTPSPARSHRRRMGMRRFITATRM